MALLREDRSVSQVVFNFLPGQVADLRNRVWRTERWREPRHLRVDLDSVRRELRRALTPWTAVGLDGDLGRMLDGIDIEVVTPTDQGVDVVAFGLYRCRRCGQIERDDKQSCVSGNHRSWGSFQFVSYHTCGKIREPFVPRCQVHQKVCVAHLPASRNARDVRFTCPVCNVEISRGVPPTQCDCGLGGIVKVTPPRSSSLYQGQNVVVINAPRPEDAVQYATDSARATTVAWVVDGMQNPDPLDAPPTLEGLAEQFERMRMPREQARRMAEAALREAGGAMDRPEIVLGPGREDIIDGALKLAYATIGGRQTVSDLRERATEAVRDRYAVNYANAMRDARLADVMLLEKFPVITAFYGYARGDGRKEPRRLNWFRERGTLRLYSLKVETEALLFMLDPLAVAAWLAQRGLYSGSSESASVIRAAILREVVVPHDGDDGVTMGSELLKLVHSYAHRVVRTLSAFCGIDREGLGEYLIPEHLAFIVYANSRSDFVLGGLQALFENDLDRALNAIVHGERRCALDPGCSATGAACMACLHVGEPTCRHFNRSLDRHALFGSHGLLSGSRTPVDERLVRGGD